DQDLLRIFLSGDSDHVSLSRVEPREWAGDMIPASIERKANSFELPFSLRMIQRKKQRKEGVKEAGESAYCSVKKAFSCVYAMSTNVACAVAPLTVTMESILSIDNQRHTEIDSSSIKTFEVNSGGKPLQLVVLMAVVEMNEGEFGKWKSLVKEADNMQDVIRYGVLDRQTMQRFVSPVNAKVMEG
nr:hypothetical protein [Tanacetum cinerariifolium]